MVYVESNSIIDREFFLGQVPLAALIGLATGAFGEFGSTLVNQLDVS